MSKKILLVLFFCLIFTNKVSAADYSKQLSKTENNIRTVQTKIKEGKKVLRKTKRIIKEFKKRFRNCKLFILPDYSQCGDVELIERLYRINGRILRK